MSLLWVDKFCPLELDGLDVHETPTKMLKTLANSEEVPHLLLTGPAGSGKMTRARAFIRKLFGGHSLKMKIEEKIFQTPSGKKIHFPVYSSSFHIEISPSDANIYDRVVIQEILKEFSQSPPIEKSSKRFKVAVILEAEKLTKDAQHALRRTMEKYSSNVRIVLLSSSSSRILRPIRSRCLQIRLETPNTRDLLRIVSTVVSVENLKYGEDVLAKIVRSSKGNIRTALLLAEEYSKQYYVIYNYIQRNRAFDDPPFEWKNLVADISKEILKEQSPTALLVVRSKLYSLLSHAIQPTIIIKELLDALIASPKMLTHIASIIEIAAIYEHRLGKSNKAIYHLEAFVAKVMSLIT